ncbi:uncharacterized protein LOC127715933 [Mytilus californianus]|uniref:uncharacterized protein LOC127715933 n=1 Tax=Mytilus californianus TaxID=6549 RepID=UPI0022471676|nr:uncharacterized protein LOC127715933 [Mytilus californianus]
METILWILFFGILTIITQGDPCIDYKVLDSADDSRRSAANGYGQLCDNTLESGWYRIISKAGERMPTECIVGGFRCGTMSSIWMNGTYPITNEIKSVTACTANYNGNCCANSHQIKVKNCTNYLVYSLVPVAPCSQAYCFGSELPCPTGETSDNGFSPGCELPKPTTLTTITSRSTTKAKSNTTIFTTIPSRSATIATIFTTIPSRSATIATIFTTIPSRSATIAKQTTTTSRSTTISTVIPYEISTTLETIKTSRAAIDSSMTTTHSVEISTTSLVTKHTTTHLPQKDEKATSMTVVGLTVLVVFLLIVIAVFVVIFRRKPNCLKDTKSTSPPTYEETVKTENITNPYAQIEDTSHYSCINDNNYNEGYDEIPYEKNQTVQDNKLYLQNFATIPALNQIVEENKLYLQKPLSDSVPLDNPE